MAGDIIGFDKYLNRQINEYYNLPDEDYIDQSDDEEPYEPVIADDDIF